MALVTVVYSLLILAAMGFIYDPGFCENDPNLLICNYHPEFQPFVTLKVYNSCFYLLLIWVKYAVCNEADD